MSFYAYLHARPDTKDAFGIFYVGKGKGGRAYELKRANVHHRNVVGKYGEKNILVGKMDCSTEQIAFELEKGLIKCLRRAGVCLANRTDGGEGTAGLVWTESHKARMSAAHRGKRLTSEHRAKLSESHKGQTAWNKGVPSPLRGRTLSDEVRKKLSESAIKRTYKHNHSEETKVRIANAVSRSRWYNDGSQNKRIQPETVSEYEKSGWVPGKIKPVKGK